MAAFPFERQFSGNKQKENESCPYCCAESSMLVLHGRSFRMFAVKCLNCEALGPLGEDERQALDKWNFRGAQGFIRNIHKRPWLVADHKGE